MFGPCAMRLHPNGVDTGIRAPSARYFSQRLEYYEEVDVLEALREITGGRGPDSCIDAVGMESHGTGPEHLYDRAKQALMLESDRPLVLRQIIHACRKGGTV